METSKFEPFEPKRENRFYVEFQEPFNIPAYVTKETKRPSFTLTRNNTIVWDDFIFKMYDPIVPSSAEALMKGIRELRTKDSQIIKVKIKGLDPTGGVIEEWEIIGEIEKTDFGTLSYKSDEPIIISVYFKTHYVILQY